VSARVSKAAAGWLPYLPALDGLRAVAILGVLLYHAGLAWAPGGFLGVEVFFVISGYLITSLLLAEWRQRGRIAFAAFWLRRARRLLPALFLLIAVTLAFAVVFLPDEVAGLRTDTLAALGYVTNWYLIFSHKPYFETVGRPPLLQHLWSLAVEEQFYLLWPLLFAAGMRLPIRGGFPEGRLRFAVRRRRLLVAVLVGAALSTVWMAALYQPDADPSRMYYGTDTRAAGLLVGAALALVWIPEQLRVRGRATGAGGLLLDAAGLAALAALLGFYRWLDEFQPALYRGGFAAVALATAVVIAAAVHPRTRLIPGLLGWRLLRWVGLRSYGLYLWHWPIFMVTRPQLDLPLDGLPLLGLRLVATCLMAELSYRYVETPIRSGAVGRAWTAWRETRGTQRWRLGLRWAGATATVAVVFFVVGISVVEAQPPAAPAYLSVTSIDTVPTVIPPAPSPAASTTAAALPSSLPASPAPSSTPPPPSPAAPTPAASPPASAGAPGISPSGGLALAQPAPAAPPASPAPARLSAGRVTAIGDSVMLGVVSQLQHDIPGIQVNAAVGRQVSAAIGILQAYHASDQLGTVVIIDLGNNGTFTAGQFDQIMHILAGVPRVVFVNVKVPRPWQDANNTVLAEGVKRYPNAVLIDWHAASAGRPDLFWRDGLHLRPQGAQVYADLVAASLQTP
jgi:peptidoglycan/LPS O-acetylase OafA/YrhL/lysophospholipase L1-like esterase